MCVVGLIADTHGLLRPQACDALRGSDFIIHAGDIGDPAILDALSRLAPLTAIRGNVDVAAWASALPDIAVLRAGGVAIQIVHDLATLAFDPAAAGIAVVVSGHSHRPRLARAAGGVLLVNPGSAGRRRFRLPVSLGRLVLCDGQVRAELIDLAC